ncbi:MAG: radical SAM protein [Candidatus Woesearchaeota archaeon]
MKELFKALFGKKNAKFVKNKNSKNNSLNYYDLVLKGVLSKKKAFIGPEEVHIDLTNMCNNNCIGCWCNSPYLGELRMPPEVQKQTLSFSVLKRTIDELAELGTKRIKLIGGGEPTLHPNFMEIVDYISNKRIECWINTNLLEIDKKKVEKIVKAGVRLIDVSLWASNPKTYVKTHTARTEKDFINIKKNLERFYHEKKKQKTNFPIIRIYNVIFNMNYKEIEQMIDFALNVHADKVQFVFLEPIPKKTEFLLINEEQKNELKEIVNKIKKNIVGIDGSEDVYRDDKGREVKITDFTKNFVRRLEQSDISKGVYDEIVVKELPCYVGWVFARIMADGSVVPCLKAHRMPIGNIYKKSFKKIWNSKKYQTFRKMCVTYKKKHSYFKKIGNDPAYGCLKICDNLWQNELIQRKLVENNIKIPKLK